MEGVSLTYYGPHAHIAVHSAYLRSRCWTKQRIDEGAQLQDGNHMLHFPTEALLLDPWLEDAYKCTLVCYLSGEEELLSHRWPMDQES